MTYDQLVMLENIVTHGSFKSASQKLFKSQPSLSVAIKNLEQEFQIQLFDRSGYKPKLTTEGRAFYERSKNALAHMRELSHFATELGMGVEPEIRLSVDGIIPLTDILKGLKDFFDNNLSTSLNLSVDYLSGTTKRIQEGLIDFGITQVIDSSLPFVSKPFTKITMTPVCSTSLLSHARELDNLKKIPHVIVRDSSPDSSMSSGLIEGARQWYVTDMQTKYEIIRAGLGWGRLPRHMVSADIKSKLLKKIPIKSLEQNEVQLHLIRYKDKALGPVGKELWKNL